MQACELDSARQKGIILKVRAIFIVALAAAFLTYLAAPALAALNPNAGLKVTICHKTGKGKGNTGNGFSILSPNVRSIIAALGGENGHEYHEGDIIPAFTYWVNVGSRQPDYQAVEFPGQGDASLIETGCVGDDDETTEDKPKASVTSQGQGDCNGGSVVTITNTGNTDVVEVVVNGEEYGEYVYVSSTYELRLKAGEVVQIEGPGIGSDTITGAPAKDCDTPDKPDVPSTPHMPDEPDVLDTPDVPATVSAEGAVLPFTGTGLVAWLAFSLVSLLAGLYLLRKSGDTA